MPDLPGGTLTFLFTDIEGSTRLWEHRPAEMAVALARHDAVLCEAVQRNDGFVFATAGDAFCAAFPTASRALTAALTAQAALGREPWPEPARIKVRMALHTGAAELRDNDYFGPPLNRVARLLAAGHGGRALSAASGKCRRSRPCSARRGWSLSRERAAPARRASRCRSARTASTPSPTASGSWSSPR